MSNEEKVKQILELKPKLPNNIAIQTFDLDYYKSLSPELQTRFLKCLDSGRENTDSHMGCYANNPDDYETFKPFFKRALEVYHKVDLSKQKHVNDWNFAGVAGLPSSGVLDLSKIGLPPLSMRVRTGRNLNKFPLPASMTKEDRIALELEMGKVFDQLIADPSFGGRYVSITPGHKNYIDAKEYQALVDANIMFKDMSADPYLNSAGLRMPPAGVGAIAFMLIYVSREKSPFRGFTIIVTPFMSDEYEQVFIFCRACVVFSIQCVATPPAPSCCKIY